MRLRRFKGFDEVADLKIEDVSFFYNMLARMVEDVDVGAFFVAKSQDRELIDGEVMSAAIGIVDSEWQPPLETELTDGVVITEEMVRDFSRAPLRHEDEAVALLTRFVNHHLTRMLKHAATQATEDGLTVIKLRHYLPWCEHWPYPLNRYC